MKTCGDFKKFREKKGWTWEDASKECKISVRTVGNIEARKNAHPLSREVLMSLRECGWIK